MDWKPWEVKRASVADFMASLKGWQMKHGVKDEDLAEEEAADIRRLAFDD